MKVVVSNNTICATDGSGFHITVVFDKGDIAVVMSCMLKNLMSFCRFTFDTKKDQSFGNLIIFGTNFQYLVIFNGSLFSRFW